DGTFDLKGYTSNPDVKVESYSDEARIGNYYIGGITVTVVEKVDADGNPIDENGLPVYEQKLDENGEPVLDANGKPVMNQISEPVMIKTLDTTNAIFKPVDASGDPIQITLPSGKQVDALDIVNPKCTVAEDGYTLTVTGDNQFSMTLTFDISGKNDGDTIASANIELTGIGAMTMQIGANEGQTLDIRIPTVSSKSLGIHQVDVTKREDARLSINRISNALDTISSIRSRLGAYQNRLESSVSSLDVTEENMTSAYSRIMDVNMAEEMTEYTKNQVLVQAGTSMLAQANERPSQVLQLLQ
ncbi:MAG: flagellin, partial [Lachnospiraceae bacterium]|nr:flagellin [Lachnospiraceae bacterium]